MSLISGGKLDPKKYFKSEDAVVRGTAVDLKIGTIFDPDGNEVDGCYSLKPGEMVQVVSREIFNLPENVTGFVTYKTGLTRIGIWALTVGIVDSGWDGPIATTLLNFSKAEYPVKLGETFLRVSLFEHEPVKPFHCKSIKDYKLDVKGTAVSTFPRMFLNQDELAKKAGEGAFETIRASALSWVGLLALTFAIIALATNTIQFVLNGWSHGSLFHSTDMDLVQTRMDNLETRLDKVETEQSKIAAPPKAIEPPQKPPLNSQIPSGSPHR
jgi:deoxycytidine triphosphate deaminase